MNRYRRPPPEPYVPGNHKITAARLAFAKKLRAEGLTNKEIGERMNLSRETIRQWLAPKK